MSKKQYAKLKSETAQELTGELIQDIKEDNVANSKEYEKAETNPTYDEYLKNLSGGHEVSREQKSGDFQSNNFLAGEMEAFGLNSEIEQDADRGPTKLLENLKTNKTSK